METKRPYLLLVLLIFWLAIAMGMYYFTHKPLTPDLFFLLTRRVGQLLVPVSVLVAAGGLGVRLASGADLPPFTRSAVQVALGLGCYAILILLLGNLIGLNSYVLWGVLLASWLLNWRAVQMWMRSWRTLASPWVGVDRLSRGVALGVGMILLSTLLTALAPPLKFDALVYHFALPRAYLDAGRITYLPWLMFWGMPQTVEMLYTWVMGLAGVEAAAVLGWMMGILALTGVWGFVAEIFNRRAAWVAVAALLSGQTLALSLAWGYVGWTTMLFGITFIVAIRRWVQTEALQDLLLAGIFAGFALGTKYTAGVLLVCGIGILSWHSRGRSVINVVRVVVIFVGAATLVSLPWWVKNGLATSNPFYPFFFPAGAMNELRLTLYQGSPDWSTWPQAAALPFIASWHGQEGVPGYGASIGPLLLAFGALSWWGGSARSEKQRRTLRIVGIVSGTGLLMWGLASQFSSLLNQTRLYFVLFPAFALLAAAGFDALARLRISGVRLGRVVGVLVLLVLWLNAFQVGLAMLRQDAPQAVFSLRSETDYLTKNLGWYGYLGPEIAALSQDARVLMLWEPRSYNCLPRCLPDETLDRWLRDSRVANNTAQILQEWQQTGITHLLYHQSGADFTRSNDQRYHSDDWRKLDAMLAELTPMLSFGEAYTLYALETP